MSDSDDVRRIVLYENARRGCEIANEHPAIACEEASALRASLSAVRSARDRAEAALLTSMEARDCLRGELAEATRDRNDLHGRLSDAVDRLTQRTTERDAALVEREEMLEALRVLVERRDRVCAEQGLPSNLDGTEGRYACARALLARPATVSTLRAREALAALTFTRLHEIVAGEVGVTTEIDEWAKAYKAWQAAHVATAVAEKEAADAEAK
jgi:hypothetical protein